MKMKKTKKILSLFIFLFLFNCQSISNKYNTTGEKICVYLNINNNNDRLFLKRFKENPNISNIDDCDYLSLIFIQQTQRAILNSVGIRILNSTTFSAYYDLYKIEKDKISEVKQILDNPSVHEHIDYTGGKNPMILKSSATINENKEIIYENQSENRVYTLTKARVGALLGNISSGFNIENGSSTVNYNLLTNLQQSREDIEKQLVQTLADRTYDDVLLDILEYKKNEMKKNSSGENNNKNESEDKNKNEKKNTQDENQRNNVKERQDNGIEKQN